MRFWGIQHSVFSDYHCSGVISSISPTLLNELQRVVNIRACTDDRGVVYIFLVSIIVLSFLVVIVLVRYTPCRHGE